MKKAVPILIMVIFVASIAIVGFFGMKIRFAEESIYVREVRFTNQGIQTEDDGRRVLFLFFEPATDGYMEYQLTWEVLDDNATNKNVRFVYDTTLTKVQVINNDNVKGLIRFQEGAHGFTIGLVPDDGGGGKGDEITIILI